MDSVRDLYVGIRLDDDASRELKQMDRNVDKTSLGFATMANQVEYAKDELEDLGMSGLVVSRMLDEVADEADDVGDKMRFISFQASIVTMQASLMGMALAGAFAGAVAAAAPLLVILGALGASLLAAGVGLVGFGAVAVSALKPVFEDAENMTKAQREAREELEQFQEFWGGFAKQFENPILDTFTQGLDILQKVMTGLGPTISDVSNAINQIFYEMNSAIDGGGLDGFFTMLESGAATSLYNLAHTIGNTIGGITNLLGAFYPVTQQIEIGLLGMTQRFQDWSAGLSQSDGFQKFIDYALTNGPVLMSTMGNIFSIVGDLVVALAPLGTVVLQGLQLLTGFIAEHVSPKFREINDIVVSFSGVFTQYLLPAIMPLIQQWLPVLSQWFDNIKLVGTTLVETFIAIFPTLQDIFMSVLPIAIDLFGKVQSIISTLITEVVIPLLPKIATVLSEVWSVAKPILDPLHGLFNQVLDTIMFLVNEVVVPLIPKISSTISSMWGVAKPILEGIVGVFGSIVDMVSSAVGKIQDFIGAVKNFKMPSWVSTIGNAVGKGASVVKDWVDGSHATGLYKVPFDGYAAELHQGETVLTASQSNALKSAGVLQRDGERPRVELGGNEVSSIGTSSENKTSIHAPVTIEIKMDSFSTKQDAVDVANVVKNELDKYFVSLGVSLQIE
ncbi:phage tail protein [Metabacillus litoralis]|uniref:phage tail protein n=1 Tax=Metabacillus litoralis TaxID=152268 RepID=UPI00203C9E40|nr:hypothetical protein [Metabacillus litoralis]MCM3413519.1 hypothetical protein [Metabacillus litoralis]